MTEKNYRFHFIFGLEKNFNNKEFRYFHYLNLKSCFLTQNQPEILIHYLHQPQNNYWWDKSKDFCKLILLDNLQENLFFKNNQTISKLVHKVDILRLFILKKYGGVYADMDTLFYKPFFEAFNNKGLVMGKEGVYRINDDFYDINGLCNALIISNNKSEFLDLWIDSFNYHYDQNDYNRMAVKIPYEISKNYSQLIHVEPVKSFHKYNWNECFYDTSSNEKFCSCMNENGIFSKHMAESKVFHILKNINRDYFNYSDSLYSKMCNNIEGLL